MKAPWKHHPNARTCMHCGSQRPGMQPLSLKIDGKIVRGYWHLKCFEATKQSLKRAQATDARNERNGNGRTN